MFKVFVVAAICLQAVSPIAEAADRKPLSCTNTLGAATFATFKDVCLVIHDKNTYESTASTLSLENRLDVIETCSCALVNHDLTWASMMTHESEALFQAIKKLIDETDQYLNDIHSEPQDEADKIRIDALKVQFNSQIQIKSEVKKTELIAAAAGWGDAADAERMYYWDRLSQIIRDGNDENNCDKVSAMVQRAFGLVLYEPDEMSYKLANGVIPNTNLVAPVLKRLSDLASNPRYFYRLSTYNDNLYKLRMNTLMCKYLEKKNQLVSKDRVLQKHRVDDVKQRSRARGSRAHLKSRRYVESDSSDDDDDDYSSDDDDNYVKGVSPYSH